MSKKYPDWMFYTSIKFKEVKRKTKIKLICNDGVLRRFANGVDDTKTRSEKCIPVMCLECGYDFGFFDIYEKTEHFLKEHRCEKS